MSPTVPKCYMICLQGKNPSGNSIIFKLISLTFIRALELLSSLPTRLFSILCLENIVTPGRVSVYKSVVMDPGHDTASHWLCK
jgi:hypothetical protein